MASGIPKRAGNTRKKEKRKESWIRGQEKKAARIADQKKREEHNRKVGTTGKQRANQAAKVSQAILGKATIASVQIVEAEDLLEI